MKQILAIIIMLLAVPVLADRSAVIFGDSISAKRDSWPQHLRDEYGWHVSVQAQSFRTTTHFGIPRDLGPFDFDRVIYFLGTNDAAPGAGQIEFFRRAFSLQMLNIAASGMPVTVIVPPVYNHPHYSKSILPIREHILNVCKNPLLHCIDAERIWVDSMTLDGIHPTAELSRIIAGHIDNALR